MIFSTKSVDSRFPQPLVRLNPLPPFVWIEGGDQNIFIFPKYRLILILIPLWGAPTDMNPSGVSNFGEGVWGEGNNLPNTLQVSQCNISTFLKWCKIPPGEGAGGYFITSLI